LRHDLSFAPDGRLLVGAQTRVLLDALGPGSPVELTPPTGAFTAYAQLALGGRALVYTTPTDNNHVHVWDLQTNRIAVWEGAGQDAKDLAVSPNGSTLYVSHATSVRFEWQTELRAFDLTTGRPTRRFTVRAGCFSSLTVCADGTRLAGRHSWSVGLWDLTATDDPGRGWLEVKAGNLRSHVLGSALSADGSRLATITHRGITLWDVTRPAASEVFRSGKHKRAVTAVACRPTKPLIATGDNAGKVFLWDHAGNVLTRYDWGLGEVYGLAFAPDGLRCAAVDTSGKVVIWDVDA
jgi:WD40 repeat protein